MNSVILALILTFPVVTMGQEIDYDSTFKTNGQEFRVQRIQLDKYKTLLRIGRGQETILMDTMDFSHHLEIQDFNGDGDLDILVSFTGNIVIQSLFLFDQSGNKFQLVADFEKYPSPSKVNGSHGFYYSYRRAGCADNYWTSDLFNIEDFKVIHLAHISGNACEEPVHVKVYRIKHGNQDLVDRLPYKIVNERRDKWEFLDVYWSKHYGAYK